MGAVLEWVGNPPQLAQSLPLEAGHEGRLSAWCEVFRCD